MKDFFTRILTGAVISAVVSAGLIYFAFDQSLRGVEAGLSTVSDAVGQNGEWIRENRRAIDQSSEVLSEKLQLISNQITANSSDAKDDFARYANVSGEMMSIISTSLTSTSDAIALLSAQESLSSRDKEQILRLIQRIEDNQTQLQAITATLASQP